MRCDLRIVDPTSWRSLSRREQERRLREVNDLARRTASEWAGEFGVPITLTLKMINGQNIEEVFTGSERFA